MLSENEIATTVVDACYRIHTQLGPGLLESVYETVLEFELKKRGLCVQRQVGIPIEYEGNRFDVGFRVDLLVEERVILELKSIEQIAPVHRKQVLTYLKLTNLKLGILINFGSALIKDGITRLVHRLDD